MARRPKNDTPVMRTVRAAGHRSRAYRTDVGIRDFNFIIDEPEKLGGENLGPTPMEYVTGALSGCFVVTLEMVSEDQEFNMISLDVDCEGVVDHRGLFGTADVSPHFQSAKVDITIITDEPAERHAEFERETLVRCPVYNLIKDSGVDIPVNWTFKKE
ncbi:MAG: OsmC family protein [Rhodospirillales bacterium]|nr:OsmC family protein [Rhodospirillales bacterium]